MRFMSSLAALLSMGLAYPPLAQAQVARTDSFFDSDGVRIRYVDQGSGPTVLLIHGFIVSTDLSWIATGILDSLASGYRAIALDLRGHGESEKPHDPAAYGQQMVADVVRLLDHLGIEKAHIAGYSMGGNIALNLMTRHPHRVASVVLGGFAWRAPGSEPSVLLRLLPGRLEAISRGEITFSQLLASGGMADMTPAMRTELDSNDPDALMAVLSANEELFTITESELRANTVPVLAIVGELDPERPGVERMAEIMPHLETDVIPGATHITAASHPHFLQAVIRFLASRQAVRPD